MKKFNKRTISMILSFTLIMSAFLSCGPAYAEDVDNAQNDSAQIVDDQGNQTSLNEGENAQGLGDEGQQEENESLTDGTEEEPREALKATPQLISGATVTGLSNTVYTGEEITHNITVKLGGKVLKQGTDYKVSYKNNINVGTAQVTITGIGSYKGSIVKYFKIALGTPKVEYRTHVQRVGWQGWVKDGATSGTTGRSLRIEALVIKLNTGGLSGGIRYKTHVQRVGWQEWKTSGEMAGTSGKSLRAEAMQVELTGEMAQKYDIYYRAHVQNFGWMAWAKNGGIAGTSGLSRRVEALQIKLYSKGTGPDISKQKGVYFMEGSNMYYRDSSGTLVKGWFNASGSRRYFDKSTGAMLKGWQTIDGNKYYFDPGNGLMAKGLRAIGSNRYYFNTSTGVMLKGWQTIGGNKYYFNTSSGAALKGWQTIGSDKYYFDGNSGVMRKGWQTIGGKRYYFDSNGRYIKDAGTYIDINLSTQHLTYYYQGQIIRSVDIISGRPTMPTPTGTFKIQPGRGRNVRLVGDDYDVRVDYWLPFIGSSVGMHDAYWQWAFGGDIYKYRGSHGCVNVPYATIVYLYENVENGTKVIVHY